LFETDALHLETVAGFTDDGDAAFQLEKRFQALAKQLVVVGQYDPNVVSTGVGAPRVAILVVHVWSSSVVKLCAAPLLKRGWPSVPSYYRFSFDRGKAM
jgi:hypothetical protein